MASNGGPKQNKYGRDHPSNIEELEGNMRAFFGPPPKPETVTRAAMEDMDLYGRLKSITDRYVTGIPNNKASDEFRRIMNSSGGHFTTFLEACTTEADAMSKFPGVLFIEDKMRYYARETDDTIFGEFPVRGSPSIDIPTDVMFVETFDNRGATIEVPAEYVYSEYDTTAFKQQIEALATRGARSKEFVIQRSIVHAAERYYIEEMKSYSGLDVQEYEQVADEYFAACLSAVRNGMSLHWHNGVAEIKFNSRGINSSPGSKQEYEMAAIISSPGATYTDLNRPSLRDATVRQNRPDTSGSDNDLKLTRGPPSYYNSFGFTGRTESTVDPTVRALKWNQRFTQFRVADAVSPFHPRQRSIAVIDGDNLREAVISVYDALKRSGIKSNTLRPRLCNAMGIGPDKTGAAFLAENNIPFPASSGAKGLRFVGPAVTAAGAPAVTARANTTDGKDNIDGRYPVMFRTDSGSWFFNPEGVPTTISDAEKGGLVTAGGAPGLRKVMLSVARNSALSTGIELSVGYGHDELKIAFGLLVARGHASAGDKQKINNLLANSDATFQLAEHLSSTITSYHDIDAIVKAIVQFNPNGTSTYETLKVHSLAFWEQLERDGVEPPVGFFHFRIVEADAGVGVWFVKGRDLGFSLTQYGHITFLTSEDVFMSRFNVRVRPGAFVLKPQHTVLIPHMVPKRYHAGAGVAAHDYDVDSLGFRSMNTRNPKMMTYITKLEDAPSVSFTSMTGQMSSDYYSGLAASGDPAHLQVCTGPVYATHLNLTNNDSFFVNVREHTLNTSLRTRTVGRQAPQKEWCADGPSGTGSLNRVIEGREVCGSKFSIEPYRYLRGLETVAPQGDFAKSVL